MTTVVDLNRPPGTAGQESPGGVATATVPAMRGKPGRRVPVPPRTDAGRGTARRPSAPLVCMLGADLVCMAAAVTAAGGGPAAVVTATALVAALNAALRLYRPRMAPSLLDDCMTLAAGGLGATALAAALGAGVPPMDGLRGWVLAGLLYAVLVWCCRGAGYAALRRPGVWPGHRASPALLIGAGGHGRRLARAMLAHPEYGLSPIGFLDDRPPDTEPLDPALPDAESPVPVLGRTDRMAETLRAHDVRVVIVTPALSSGGQIRRLVRVAGDLGCAVFFAPDPGDFLVDFLPPRDRIRGFPLLRMRARPQERATWPLKRLMDVVLALAGLLVSAPVLAVCALALRREGGPGVLFRQSRVGLRGRRFELLKLRTMKPADQHESATRWSIADDRRVGPVGRMLRRTSLDELPQLWNILRGDMSIVGPRPERPFFVERFSASVPLYGERHRVPVGLTGWAQVHGLRGDTSIEDRARFDNHYIDDWSLWSDIKIMVRTAGSVLRSDGG
ncbi:sugar transferase [Planobispora siamensis]|uniref:UDP-phosphate galactose phosphotransferase n=1 Tax=Planobispora siamensis TaxID=936338 RepID=A0A8J3WGU4_9ACTN|nr:sugar transferase [Planobispora siamensis]GIH89779.1 UDP-phosphate galactose phosphotransferase [Planobispora siamensis]